MTFPMLRQQLLPASLSAFALLFLLSSTATLGAQTTASSTPKDPRVATLLEAMSKVHSPIEPAISPDGTTVAWSARSKDGVVIHLSNVNAPDPAKDKLIGTNLKGPEASCSSTASTWSPDGNTLAFLSTCTGKSSPAGQQQILLWSKATGEIRQLTHVTGSLDDPAWSPDGKAIAFLFVENATRTAGALDAMKPPAGVIGEDGVEIQRVAAIDVTSGHFVQATPANLHVYEFDWAPDSTKIAFVAAPPPGENTWWIAQLYTEPLSASILKAAEPKSILNTKTIAGSLHELQIAVPRWSPDGSQIAFIGGLMSDQGSTGGDVYVMPSVGGEPRDVTPGRTSTPAYIHWVDGTKIGISEHLGGSSRIAVLDLETGEDLPGVGATYPESIGTGMMAMSISTSSDSRSVAFIRSSFERMPEVWAGALDNLKQISHLNDGIKPSWGKTEDITWTNEGFKIQGWLLYPANYDPNKKYPLVVFVHGGPSSAAQPRWPGAGYGGAPFSALGYFAFMPNPRGSYGQGEKFTQANVKDFGYGDMRDILAGMDTLEKRLPIDKDREGITGWSYGGFMTMFGVTQTTRFKAAVAGAGISDWQSYYGENSIDQWMIPFFGKSVYDDPAIYAKSSAINFIKSVKTPTLVVVGDRDGECPAPQSYEFWHALRAEGVKTQLVVYPNEGHGFRDPAHRLDVLERALEWFATEMPAK
ncbi:S9 family peptidase [Granulicella arctica]|uniref:Dipeptidyl aminopeptidase/acylaminoacyl peptidase n=1 Tax=Granulicella arctica TaxID=940613 RepID=A0A7Y9PG82_9BACT|nr:S9 family peptidase [Granulicella arctica]NYF79327.1 dipeptidyl aminopeptidase/acylaminoacyl peptidase [Granulicella arctica]